MTDNPGPPQGEPGYWEQQAQQPPQAPYWQPGYPPQPYGYYPPPLPQHPEASKAMTLGLIALIGGVTCLLPVVIGPWAWIVGTRVKREIAASQGRLGGLNEATTGQVLGILATALLLLGMLLVALTIALVAASDSTSRGIYV
jgi:hypothetical protein